MKKFISFVLCLVMLLTMALPAFAAENYSGTKTIQKYSVTDNSKVIPLKKEETVVFDAYDVQLNGCRLNQNQTITDFLLSLCDWQSSAEMGNHNVIHAYSSEVLHGYLKQCDIIYSIEYSVPTNAPGHLIIMYRADDGNNVTLTYRENELVEKLVYNPKTDYMFMMRGERAEIWTHFAEGTVEEITPEYEAFLDECREKGAYDVISEVINDPSNEVTFVSAKDSIMLVPEQGDSVQEVQITQEPLQTMSTSYPGFETVSSLVANLREHFPPYAYTTMSTASKASSALGTNVSLKIKESRYNYVKKTASAESFAVGTTLTVIGAFLSPGASLSVKVVGYILNGIGILYSANDLLQEAVTLHRSAVCTYDGGRYGYALDTTVYNDYVRVASYVGKGEFTGGYNSRGNFDWVHSLISTAFDHSYSSIHDKVIYLYNADVQVNGYCSQYEPD